MLYEDSLGCSIHRIPLLLFEQLVRSCRLRFWVTCSPRSGSLTSSGCFGRLFKYVWAVNSMLRSLTLRIDCDSNDAHGWTVPFWNLEPSCGYGTCVHPESACVVHCRVSLCPSKVDEYGSLLTVPQPQDPWCDGVLLPHSCAALLSLFAQAAILYFFVRQRHHAHASRGLRT